MKKIIRILFVIFSLIVLECPTHTTFADESKSCFAKITSTATQFCSSPSESSMLFELPYSYFVKVNYAVDEFFKVEYNGLEGYVKKDSVKLMNGTPQTPYARATFKVFVPYCIYSSANNSSEILFEVNTTTTLNYLGTKTGQQLNSSSNIWYYCSAETSNGKIFGYIFSGVTDYLTKISINEESFDIVSEDFLTSKEPTLTGLTTGTKILLIVSISVPSLMILYFLIKPSKILQATNKKRKSKKQNRSFRRTDYFEFDESEL